MEDFANWIIAQHRQQSVVSKVLATNFDQVVEVADGKRLDAEDFRNFLASETDDVDPCTPVFCEVAHGLLANLRARQRSDDETLRAAGS